ncbi:MAG: glycosyltransferase family 4 protein [bacterium]
MRVAFIINLYPPYIVGGNEMITHDLVEALRLQGHDIHVLTARGRKLNHRPNVHQVLNYDLDEEDSIFRGKKLSSVQLFRHHIFDPTTYRNVREAVTRLRPNLIAVDNQYMASAAPLLAVRDAPCPVVAQAMDKWLVYYLVNWEEIAQPSTVHRKLFVKAIRELLQPFIGRAVRLDGIATVSDFIRDYHIQAGFPPENMRSVYLGYDSTIFRPGPSHPLHDPVRLLYAGALWRGKGPQVVVKALEMLNLREDLPRFHLHIFGEGTEKFTQYLYEVIDAANAKQEVSLHGFVPWETLAEAMHEADIFVFSSIWDEPFATVPLQASGCGLPIVATRAGGTSEAFIDGETALLIPPGDAEAMADAISEIARDEELRQQLGKNAAHNAQEQWTFEAYVNRFWNFCEDTIRDWHPTEIQDVK